MHGGKLVQPLVRRFGARAGFRRAVLGSWFVSDAEALAPPALRGLFRDTREHVGIAFPELDASARIGAPVDEVGSGEEEQLIDEVGSGEEEQLRRR